MSKKRGPYSSPIQQERRRRILRAAGRQLEKHGLAALTMQSIAEISEVSTKTLYNLFGSRDLLLVEAASERLVDLEQDDSVLEFEQGIPRLLAFSVGAIKDFEVMPEYARAVIAILVRADLDPVNAYARLGPVQRFAYSSLCLASEKQELRAGLDLHELSYLIAANEWGAVLLWEKGLLRLEQLAAQVNLNHYLTLTPVCVGARREAMEAELDTLLGNEIGNFRAAQL